EAGGISCNAQSVRDRMTAQGHLQLCRPGLRDVTTYCKPAAYAYVRARPSRPPWIITPPKSSFGDKRRILLAPASDTKIFPWKSAIPVALSNLIGCRCCIVSEQAV